ncbi:MAG: DUF1343 domain-containing protein [candidate division KSB1 bacterium]|nr:DUF1343 domain-containing protein [candidate division KSB1 bacterium]MDZ7368259.1 DUF1343 domain-containing protein [candidate division KSB1 bacterium]MDZ7406759.1 DUF1343 domain-containing protein [candidate division KSB1 bacterium]
MASLKTLKSILLSVLFLSIGIFPNPILPQVKPGVEVLITKQRHLIEAKRVGLITNPTGVTADLTSTIDVLYNLPGVKLVALFGPEHGVRGDAFAGEKVGHSFDRKTGIPIYSLYNGPMAPPTPEMLRNIEVLIYDIQDIGSRVYTYIYTLALAMQGAAKAGIRVVVLDRPDPLGGDLIEGPVLDERFKSGIGMYPIPYIYGLTVGELAKFFNEEFGIHAHLTVVPMEGWQRSMLFADTGLPWVLTSPHVPHPETVFYIAATGGIGELQSLSTGVGYTLPFELIGQTWIDPENLAGELNSRNLPGVRFRPLYFRPYYFSLKDQQLAGAQIHITNHREFRPVLTQLHILAALLKLYPGQQIFNPARIKSFDHAMGTDQVRFALLRGESPESIVASGEKDLETYRVKREKYLLYR